MYGRHIKVGTVIDGRTVERAVNGTATFRAGKSPFLAPARLVTFRGGGKGAYLLDAPVPGVVRGYAESLPAGSVPSRHVKTPNKVQASDGRWRGETVHGMRTRDHDLVANTNMFDAGRVNGTVGAARGGVGPVVFTGPSF